MKGDWVKLLETVWSKGAEALVVQRVGAGGELLGRNRAPQVGDWLVRLHCRAEAVKALVMQWVDA